MKNEVKDPTYNMDAIREMPDWELAFTLSELMNDNAPIGWGAYLDTAERLLRKYDIKKRSIKTFEQEIAKVCGLPPGVVTLTPKLMQEHSDNQLIRELAKIRGPEPDTIPVALYCDGGVIGKNPSSLGGTWAWCGVDKNGNRIIEKGGYVPAPPGIPITNNHTEQIAITLALEAMPNGWSGLVCSDSQIALGRVFLGWNIKNLPMNIHTRSGAALARMGKIEPLLLQGHPTKADLKSGIGKKRGLPVSSHNVWADYECNRQKTLFHEREKE